MTNTQKELTRECLIDGNKIAYDVCSFEPFEISKRYYSKTDFSVYIGSSSTYYLNEKEIESDILIHFFKKSEEAN